ncbi:M15 family metallopeptidase [Agromyces seonyuensis]|uniref:D-alanyl-D-alanine carboxypeptidase family protein n=1 Tax=Agromyces seonyuensis TaxID=2662446 RepID=A0A6I4P220_9MICO|nr:M15 family metallopeptidase [Agromyces seonyuensis]MWB98089.1 D-alanyl-D-alanine carboxypeptidase family protein [Agromyces seonyuensis]
MPERTAGRGPIIGIVAAVLLVAIVGIVFWFADPPQATPDSVGSTEAPTRPEPATPPQAPAPVETFDKSANSIDDPNSIWIVVNKLRPLNPIDYAPEIVSANVSGYADMRPEAAAAVEQLFAAAETEAGLSLRGDSAYRRYSSQERIYNENLASLGQEETERLTARPGYSEHQTGLTMDIGAASGDCSLDTCFADTPEGQWLATNAYRFGFLLRYPADKVEVTGFQFEPWHYRFVGVELATHLHDTGVTTLEEFFGLPAAPGYAD